jgi:hypothetical protein
MGKCVEAWSAREAKRRGKLPWKGYNDQPAVEKSCVVNRPRLSTVTDCQPDKHTHTHANHTQTHTTRTSRLQARGRLPSRHPPGKWPFRRPASPTGAAWSCMKAIAWRVLLLHAAHHYAADWRSQLIIVPLMDAGPEPDAERTPDRCTAAELPPPARPLKCRRSSSGD